MVEGDIILEIDGQRLDSETSLISVIRQKQIGDSITMKVIRKDEEVTLTAVLEELPQ